jgi:hypothetical protein
VVGGETEAGIARKELLLARAGWVGDIPILFLSLFRAKELPTTSDPPLSCLPHIPY